MTEGVEIIIRKKPAVSLGSLGDSVKKGSKFIGILIVVLALGFGAYKFLPGLTSLVAGFGGEPFTFTITASATEKYFEGGIKDITFVETSASDSIKVSSPTTAKLLLYDGEDFTEKTSFYITPADSIRLSFEYLDGGGSVLVLQNGQKIFSDIGLSIKGAQLKYEDIKEFEETRKVTQEGSGKVSRREESKQIVEVTATPEATKGGNLSIVSYEVTDDNANVKTWVENGWLYAKYVAPETPEETGNATA